MKQLHYAVLDVFAEQVFEGNPLAVFADATDLSSLQMQTIAREMQLSETTFVLPRAPEIEARDGVRVRIFTTEEELPFAGHPTLGTATFLRESRAELKGAPRVQLHLNVGPIPVVFSADELGRPGHFGTMRQRDRSLATRSQTEWRSRTHWGLIQPISASTGGWQGQRLSRW